MTEDAWTDIALPGDVSKQVAAAENHRESVGQLAVHPYNEHQPELSTWWQFSRAKAGKRIWPAYHLGKFVFDKPAGRGAIRAGLHVEKGLGHREAAAFGSAKASAFELKPSWAWHGFVRDVSTGKFADALDDVSRRSSLQVEIEISVGAPLDEPKLFAPYSEYRFVAKPGGALEVMAVTEKKEKLGGLASCRSHAELGNVLSDATAEAHWTWVNVIAGCCVPIASRSPERRGRRWGGAEFWELALEPFMAWVR